MASALDMALELAAEGYYVFPLIDEGKEPDCVSWPKTSTRDPAKIRSWFDPDPVMNWPRNPNIGIDCGKSGILVIDVDVKAGKGGDRSFLELDIKHGFPETLEVRTASGGAHHYYRAFDFGNTTDFLARGIDTKCVGGYVVAPGSYVVDTKHGYEGEYVLIKRVPFLNLPEMPDWLKEKLATKRIKEKNTSALKDEDLDHGGAIARGIDWLENHAEHAVEGAHGDQTTYNTICKLRDFGISESKALELLLEHWNDECSPPWDGDELAGKVANAYKYAKNAAGVAAAHVEFAGEKGGSAVQTDFEQYARHPGNLCDEFDIEDREWVFGDLFLAGKITLCGAPGGAGKSTLMIEIGVSKTSGIDTMGIDPLGVGNVLIWNQEDDMAELNRRFSAVCRARGIDRKSLADKLFFVSGEAHKLKIAHKVGPNGRIVPCDAQGIVDFIRKKNIKLAIFDPLVEMHPASESNNEEMAQVGMIFRTIAEMTKCAVGLVHHTKKPPQADSESYDGDMDALRGASSLLGIARIVFTFFPMHRKDAKRYGVPENERWKYSKLSMAKANMGKMNEPRWFEKIGQRIKVTVDNPDGEEIGTLKRVTLTSRSDTAEQASAMFANEISGILEDAPKIGLLIDQVAQWLAQNSAMYADKQQETVEKAIRRLFERQDTIPCRTGVIRLNAVASEGRKRARQYIQLVPSGEAPSGE